MRATEVAEPGYYAVTLTDPAVRVEVSAAAHSAIYRLKSAKGGLRILVDCAYGITSGDPVRQVYASEVKLNGKRGLEGANRRRCWVDRAYAYAVEFDRAATRVEELPKREGQKAPQYVFVFEDADEVMVKVGLSACTGDGAGGGFIETALPARKNLEAEIPGWNFDDVRAAARAKWNEVLGVATIEGTDEKFYLPKPDGLCGNDDCGQMSAWYLFSAMGFYPFNPCGGEYVIGAPQVPRIELKLKVEVEERNAKVDSADQSGKSEDHLSSTSTSHFNYFRITAKNLSKGNKYVKSVTLNGKPITDCKIRHEDIMKGGELVFEMSE